LNKDITQKSVRILGLCLLVSIFIYLLLKDSEGISVNVKDDHLSLLYSSGESFDISYEDILSVTETRDLDLGKNISGIDARKYKFGVWVNNEFGKYKLSIYNNVERYILIKTFNDTYVLNLESVDATDNFYKSFKELLQSMRPEASP
jgi:hypothetical protein